MSDGLSTQARVERFDVENGMDAIIVDGAWMLFSNGAKREVSPLGALIDPPTDAFACAKLKVWYHEIKLAQAVQIFTKTRLNFLRYAKVALAQADCPSADDAAEAVEQLNQLKAKVRVCQTRLDEARQNLEKNTPDSVIRNRRMAEQNRQGQMNLITAVEQIEV